MKFFWHIFRSNRTPAEVVELLEKILDGTILDSDWDNFISVKISNPELEKIRLRMEEIWTENSPYMIEGSIDPTSLNSKGVIEVKKLIDSCCKRD